MCQAQATLEAAATARAAAMGREAQLLSMMEVKAV